MNKNSAVPFSYNLSKKFRTLKAAGINPVNWVYEVCAKLILALNFRPRETVVHNHKIKGLLKTKSTLSKLTVEKVDQHSITHMLRQNGVCIISNFVDRSAAIGAGNEILAVHDNKVLSSSSDRPSENWQETKHFLWQTDHAWSDNYLEIASFGKSVVNVRSRISSSDDAGMVDIFNIEKLALAYSLEKSIEIIDAAKSPNISEILLNISNYPLRQTNTYINRGVTKTRGPHIDNNSDPYKVFIYLSDVLDEKDGPYCYLPASHKNRRWMSFERLKNAIQGLPSTEVSSFPRDKMVKIFGHAGTAIITNQSGIHCGWPQTEDGERVVLVSNYY